MAYGKKYLYGKNVRTSNNNEKLTTDMMVNDLRGGDGEGERGGSGQKPQRIKITDDKSQTLKIGQSQTAENKDLSQITDFKTCHPQAMFLSQRLHYTR